MFKRVVTHKGFWKSVLFLTITAMVVLFVINWGLSGFGSEYFNGVFRKLLAFLVGGAIYGFTITYIKFWSKLKQQENRSK
ncbi:hypothetical protein [Patiriisocius marinus]|uniref:Uncharacterized protein n=1 Tax=Patiriisocius marinus TaxID=1397112 RepID=A0A5J4J1B0_9FLAO|nr:hypothetical protein [Patiriisocius marinus]GER60662.1 hypothetical protein ULMA_27700 [Patiriisocius marinus]